MIDMQITFVCTGNTCRSAMAQGICGQKIKERKISGISCQSCGLSAYSGDEASANAVEAVKKYGVDISQHRSRQINKYILEETDIMVCMTQSHKSTVLSVRPKCRILVPQGGISDPYGGNLKIYQQCADELAQYIDRLLDVLTMKIVPMNKSHVSGIAKLEKECFSSPWSENGIESELSDKTAHFLVGVNGENVIGYIGVHEVCGEAYVANIAVHDKYRRLGAGEKLMMTADYEAKERGCEFISLEVRKSNYKAVELYRKLGYNVAGERKNFYSNPQEDALIMTLTLKECETDENTLN